MPGELGTYLALTGDRISGGDLLELKFAEFAPQIDRDAMVGNFRDATHAYLYPKATIK